MGKSGSVLLPEDRPQEMEDLLARVRRGERVRVDPSPQDGGLMPMSLTTSPIRHASGTVVAASSNARDIPSGIVRARACGPPPGGPAHAEPGPPRLRHYETVRLRRTARSSRCG